MKKIAVALVLLIVIFSSSLLMIGCSNKECDKSSDCPAQGKCFTPRCVDGMCKAIAKDDCCGNRKCESDAGENKCICPDDCGKCSGKVSYNVTTSRGYKTLEAKYAQYLCDESKQCVIAAAEADINVLKLTNTIDESSIFKAEILSTLNQPYNTATDSIELRVRLTDITDKPLSGIRFTSLQVLSGSSLLGEKMISRTLEEVGGSFTETLVLISSQKLVEEEQAIDIKLYYEYDMLDRGSQVTKRPSKTARLTTKIMIISP